LQRIVLGIILAATWCGAVAPFFWSKA
jgi:hypothetical protein